MEREGEGEGEGGREGEGEREGEGGREREGGREGGERERETHTLAEVNVCQFLLVSPASPLNSGFLVKLCSSKALVGESLNFMAAKFLFRCLK